MGWAKYEEDNRLMNEERYCMAYGEQIATPKYRWKYIPDTKVTEQIPGLISTSQRKTKRKHTYMSIY